MALYCIQLMNKLTTKTSIPVLGMFSLWVILKYEKQGQIALETG
jgi:hypothetical protein